MPLSKIHGERQIQDTTIKNQQIATDAAIALSKLEKSVVPADGTVPFAANQSMGNNRITSLAAPVADSDAATKGYVDGLANGVDWKASVRVATTTSGTLATSFTNGSTIDGVVLATGNRILIKNQTTASENGIYTVNASGAPTRATDADVNAEVTSGLAVFVEEGTSNQNTGWMLITDGSIVLGTTALSFTQFTGTVLPGTVLHNDKRVKQTFTGNGSTSVFTLSGTPLANTLDIYLNGLLQLVGSGNDFTTSGTTVTFATAPDNGAIIQAIFFTA